MKTTTFFRSSTFTLAATAALLPTAINSCLAHSPTPSVAVPSPVGVSWHKIAVKYITPKDILTTMNGYCPIHWPEGVVKIYALEEDSSLFIQATPDGFNAVKDILKTLNVEPPIVQIKVKYVRVPITEVQSLGIKFTTYAFPSVVPSNDDEINRPYQPQKYVQIASGDKITTLFLALKKQKVLIAERPLVPVYNNNATRVNIPREVGVEVIVVPHTQKDDTIINEITPIVDCIPASFQNGILPTKQVTIKETVPSDEPILLAGLDQDAQTELLIFITPTLLQDATTDSIPTGTPSEGANQ